MSLYPYEILLFKVCQGRKGNTTSECVSVLINGGGKAHAKLRMMGCLRSIGGGLEGVYAAGAGRFTSDCFPSRKRTDQNTLRQPDARQQKGASDTWKGETIHQEATCEGKSARTGKSQLILLVSLLPHLILIFAILPLLPSSYLYFFILFFVSRSLFPVSLSLTLSCFHMSFVF